MRPKTFNLVSLPVITRASETPQAVIEFTGIDLAGASYEARVFLNNPEAGADTPLTPEDGYAGSFHVYGYSLDSTPAKAEEGVAKLARVPIHRSIPASAAVRRAAATGPTATVTLVPVPVDAEVSPESISSDVVTADGVFIRTEAGPPPPTFPTVMTKKEGQ